MSKADSALDFFKNGCNCAQSVLCAYAADFGLDRNAALSVALGFGGGIGRTQGICGAVSGAIMALGLHANFKEGEGRDKITVVYDETRSFLADFVEQKGAITCLELLSGCSLTTDEGKKRFREENLRDRCFEYVKTCCTLLDQRFSA
jgi:C_GCAxxG_C_C family probable redox protein